MKNKSNFYQQLIISILLVILILGQDFYYLFDVSIIRKIFYVIIFITFMLSFINILKVKKYYFFSDEVILFLILVIIEPINSNYIYGQPISSGYRLDLIYTPYLLYFFISYLLIEGNYKIMERLIILTSAFGSVLYILQYFMTSTIFLKGMDYRIRTRFDEPRFYIPILIFFISYYMCILKLFSQSRNKFFYATVILLNIFTIIYISKSRMYTITLIFTTVILCFFIFKKVNVLKKFFIISLSVLLIIIGTNYSKSSESIFYKMIQSTNESDLSYITRTKEIDFYLNQFKENAFLGRGEIDRNIRPDIEGVEYSFFTSDVGFLSYIVKYGILGISIFLFCIIKIIKVFVSYKNKNDYLYLLCFICFISYCMLSITIPLADQVECIFSVVLFLSLVNSLNYKNKLQIDK